MATGNYNFEIDWNDDGDFDDSNEDLTDDLIRVKYVVGRQSANPLTGKAQAGVLVATLRNDDDKYSPFNGSSALYGQMNPGIAVRLRMGPVGNSVIWGGVVERIEPEVKWPNKKRVKITCYGLLSKLVDVKVSMAMQTSILTSDLIDELLDAADFPSGSHGGETGTVTVDRFWSSNKRSVLEMLREVEATENGFIYEANTGGLDVIADGSRQTVYGSINSLATFSDDPQTGELKYTAVKHGEPLAQVYNDLRMTVRTTSVQSLAVLWTHPEATTAAGSPSIPAGETLTVWARYPTPQSALEAVAVDAWTTPVENTDYEANSADDGTGSDMSGDLSITTTKFGDACKLEIENTHGSNTAYLTLLQLRGTAVHQNDPVTVQAEDSTSIAEFGRRTFRRGEEARWTPDTATAQAWVDEQLDLYKDPQPVLVLSYLANTSDEHLTEARSRRINQRVTVDAANVVGLGIAQDFYVERMSADIEMGVRHRVEYLLSSTAAFDEYWTLGTSELGNETRANYG